MYAWDISFGQNCRTGDMICPRELQDSPLVALVGCVQMISFV